MIDRRAAVSALGFAAAVAMAVSGCGSSSPPAVTSHSMDIATAPAATTLPPAQDAAASLQDRFVRVIDAVSPSVVQIETSDGLVSGVVFDRRGDVVTNAHVVGSSHRFTVTLAGGRRYAARLVGTFAAG